MSLPLALLLGGAAALCLAALVVLLRERRSALREPLGMGMPVALADLEGRVLERNDAMRALAPAAPTVPQLFRSALGAGDEALIYRMARTARAQGFALSRVAGTAPEGERHLAARRVDDAHIAWSVLPGGPGLVAGTFRDAFEAMPFPHLHVFADGTLVPNTAFRRIFGADAGRVMEQLGRDSALDDDRLALPRADGTTGVFRHFSAAAVEGGGREVFLFPLEMAGPSRNSPTQFLDDVPAAVMQLETSGRLFWCNGRVRAVLGEAAVPGAHLADLIAPLARPVEAMLEDAALERPHGGWLTEMAHLRTGEAFLEVNIARIRRYGRVTLLAVINDASEVRRLEDQFTQSQKMEAVGKLAGGVAHDFNNVLTAIIGNCDLLLMRKDATDPDYDDLMQVVQNANRAAALVRQLLAFSRKQTLNPVTLSVREVISETHYLLNRLVGETVQLDLAIGAEVWQVRADPQQLEQVLMNLVVNARDAMEGGGTVRITAANVRVNEGDTAAQAGVPPGEHVEISVSDTGPGIDPAILDKVFDPFFTTKGKGEGTGLGLSTAYGIVRQSGGHIVAGNAPEGGARFTVYLPRSEPEEAAPAPSLPEPRVDQTGSADVMLVEDEAPVRAFAARALKLRGYNVTAAETAEDAMEILADTDHRVDLLISDVVMPGMSGPAFATEARKLRPGLPIIFVSGYAEESFRESLTESEFLFLAKPFTLKELTSKVKEALGDSG